MPHTYKSRGLRGKWSQEDLDGAVRAVTNGQSIRSAAKDFNMPEKTLRFRLKTNNLEKGRLGQPPYLGVEAEFKLETHVKKLQKAGFAPTRTELRRMPFNLAEKMEIKHPFKKEAGYAGLDWLKAFMSRHPKLSIRKAQGVSNARADGMNKEEVDKYFGLLRQVLEEHQLMQKPSNIYNVDESGLQLNNEPGQVVAERGSKAVQVRQSAERGETVTVVACCNAEGTFLPPYVIFKGVNKQQVWVENMPPGAVLEMRRESAYISESLFLNWLENHFIPRKTAGPCLLIMDGHSSHINSPEILETALQNDVHFLCLPSHSTHYLQPLDRSFFKPLKAYYRKAAVEWGVANPGKKIERRHFGLLLQKAWAQAAVISTGASGFRACGIFPFQPSAIPDYAYMCSGEAKQSEQAGPSGRLTPTTTKITTTTATPKTPKPTPTKLLQEVSPVPVVGLSISRLKQSAQILTLRTNIDEKAEKRMRRLTSKTKVTCQKRAKSQPAPPSSSEDEEETISLHDESEGSDFAGAKESDEDEMPGTPLAGDFVVVRFATKKDPSSLYVAEIKAVSGGDFEVAFLRKKGKNFYYPEIDDLSTVDASDIVKKLPNPKKAQTARTARLLLFNNSSLSRYNLR